MNRLFFVVAGLLVACGSSEPNTTPNNTATPDMSQDLNTDAEQDLPVREPTSLRVATFNTSFFRSTDGALAAELSGNSTQATEVAEILKHIRPDIVLLNEFDWDAEGKAAADFNARFLQGDNALEYPHVYVAKSNTGVHSGFDLDKNGTVVTEPGTQPFGNDAFGFGLFEGQYSFVILSKFPIVKSRTFQNFKWSDMPDSLLPTDYYGDASNALRLSSKNHVDLTVDVNGRELHILASHPTPPSFDGPEDRNGKRNHDEVRLWLDYINNATYLIDDAGQTGGLGPEDAFVIMGDLNVDPVDGDAVREAMLGILAHERVQDPQPKSTGGTEKSQADGRANQNHSGDAALDTADFSDNQVGNLRVDYVLPSTHVEVVDSAVFWPSIQADPRFTQPSDHHLVWVDIKL